MEIVHIIAVLFLMLLLLAWMQKHLISALYRQISALTAALDRAQAEIRALENKLATTDPWGDSQS